MLVCPVNVMNFGSMIKAVLPDQLASDELRNLRTTGLVSKQPEGLPHTWPGFLFSPALGTPGGLDGREGPGSAVLSLTPSSLEAPGGSSAAGLGR